MQVNIVFSSSLLKSLELFMPEHMTNKITPSLTSKISSTVNELLKRLFLRLLPTFKQLFVTFSRTLL